MKLTTERITTSVQVYPTTTTAISGSSSVSMAQYRHAVAKMFAHRLPDGLGEGVITLSLYETTGSNVRGTQVAASIATSAITSASDVILQAEIDTADMTANYTNLYAHAVSATGTVLSTIIERDEARYET